MKNNRLQTLIALSALSILLLYNTFDLNIDIILKNKQMITKGLNCI